MKESGEMYLENILILTSQRKQVRAIDLSEFMNYSKPSISRALGLLKKSDYLTIEQDGSLVLTEKGLKIASEIYERHQVLSSYFMSIGVDEQTATNDACKIEHVISPKTFDAIKKLNQK